MDRVTKLILAAIAAGLWANAITAFDRPAKAAVDYGSSIDSHLSSIESDIGRIQRGSCSNSKLC
jgi:hypothetical protein